MDKLSDEKEKITEINKSLSKQIEELKNAKY